MSRLVLYPRRELRPYVRNVMIGSFDSAHFRLPASADVRLVVYLEGGACQLAGEAPPGRLPRAFIAGGTLAPSQLQVDSGSRFLAVTFRPSGVRACLGLPASEFRGRIVPVEACLAAEDAAAFQENMYGIADARSAVRAVEALLLRRLSALRTRSAPMPTLMPSRLLLPASTLADDLGISTRQLERRFLEDYGMPLRDYRRFARFGFALAALIQPAARPGTLARIAQDAGYADQAHFAHDFRHFVGENPGTFIRALHRDDTPYRLWHLQPGELAAYLE